MKCCTPGMEPAAAQVERQRHLYERDGYMSAIPALSADEVAEALAGFKRFMASFGDGRGFNDGLWYAMNHAWLPWLRDLARHPVIVDAVARVFQTRNVYLYTTQLQPRPPGESLQSYLGIGWHRDAGFYRSRLEPVDRRHLVTAFVALSACDRHHGCLCVRPTRRHGRVDEGSPGVHLELRPGEFSLHGPSTEHTGVLNASGDTRYCVSLVYIRAKTRDRHAQTLGLDYALLVSGRDSRGRFRDMPEIPGEMTEEGRRLREEMFQRRRQGEASINDQAWATSKP